MVMTVKGARPMISDPKGLCGVCHPDAAATQVCDTCRYGLATTMQYMADLTGDSGFQEYAAPLAVDEADARIMNAFFAGANLPFEVQKGGYNWPGYNNPEVPWPAGLKKYRSILF